MRRWLFLLLPLVLFATDYDVVVIGSSPTSLFEALNQHALGNKVLLLEGTDCLGGAWQSIEACGLKHVDLGCHLIGINQTLSDFFSDYAGCKIVPLDCPKKGLTEIGKNGFYFSRGCRELTDNLVKRVASTSIDFRLKHQVNSVEIDLPHEEVIVKTDCGNFTARKMFFTPYTYFVENIGECKKKKIKFHHLYLLISDPNPTKFVYSFGIPSTTRMINLTDFLDLEGTGLQLIIFQTHDAESLKKGDLFLSKLKEKKLVDEAAYIVKSDICIYEQWPSYSHSVYKTYPDYFEILDTHNLINIMKYVPRWKEALSPYS